MTLRGVRAAARRQIERVMLRASERDGAMPRPGGPPIVRTDGGDPFRLLLAGGVVAAGLGVALHSLALPGHLSRMVAAATGHGVDVEIIGIPFATAERLRDEIAARDLSKYDAVLLLPGGIEAIMLTSSARWRADLTRLLAAVHDREPNVPVVVGGIPRLGSIVAMPRLSARLIDAATARLNDCSRRHVADDRFVRFVDSEPFGANDPVARALGYQRAAEVFAPVVLEVLACSEAGRHRPIEPDEEARLRALADLRILDTRPDPRFDAIVKATAELLDARYASVILLDRDRQWIKSAVGVDVGEFPRGGTLSELTIGRTGAFVVDDILDRPDLFDRSVMMNRLGMRSYAGYPLEAPGGQHVGILSVGDPQPHRFDTQDVTLLRTMALRAQALLANVDG
jgi:hypothetical protein